MAEILTDAVAVREGFGCGRVHIGRARIEAHLTMQRAAHRLDRAARSLARLQLCLSELRHLFRRSRTA